MRQKAIGFDYFNDQGCGQEPGQSATKRRMSGRRFRFFRTETLYFKLIYRYPRLYRRGTPAKVSFTPCALIIPAPKPSSEGTIYNILRLRSQVTQPTPIPARTTAPGVGITAGSERLYSSSASFAVNALL